MTPAYIAHYKVTAKLGQGGMGEVWRATDTKLGRDVAIKILPDSFAQDADRLARFAREAQVLASLNHPNIAAIYGVEDRALVMELVPGPTLAERMAPGPMPLEDALPIAGQIAQALEYAHEHGIVHRDLKPANVKVTPEGRVKVLDFGLAKAMTTETVAADPVSSPTLTIRAGASAVGMILGTAAYMSPEQARGQAVDKRADIWAFGVVLFEMLAGRTLFAGPTVSDTLAAVLRAEVDLSPIPQPVRSVVERCLRKDPRARWRDIGDVRMALDEPIPAIVPPPASARRSALPWVVAAVLAIALGIAAFRWWRSTLPPNHPLVRLNADLGTDARVGTYTSLSISADGTRLVFLTQGSDGRPQLSTRLLSQSKATPLSGTEDAADPFFSPDGQWIGFFAQGKLKKISVMGGAPVTLANAPNPRGAAWANDGTIIAALSLLDLSRIPAAGGAPQPLLKPSESEYSPRWPQVLPGGQTVLLTAGPAGNYENANIEVLSLQTGQRNIVLRGGYFGRVLPGGYLVYMHQGVLFGVTFDLDRRQTRGTPVPLLEDVASYPVGGAAQFTFSQAGDFVYLNSQIAMRDRRFVWLDNAGRTQPLPVALGSYNSVRLSPDGSRLALSGAPAAPSDLWQYDWQRDAMSRLTFTAQGSLNPTWTPDGKHLAFTSGNTIFWMRPDGAGEPQPLLETKSIALSYSFSPDGRRLAFSQFSARTDFDLWTSPLDLSDSERPKAGKPELFLGTPALERDPAFSPDGLWIAYDSVESGSYEIYVRPFPAAGGKWQISTAGGQYPTWSRHSHQLFYVSLDNRIMVADYGAKSGSFEAGKPRIWSNQRLAPTFPYPNMALHPDDKRFLALVAADAPEEQKTAVQANFLLNFTDELKRRIR